ncbi:MAG: 3-(3-hydroxy-phenyl)propionate hydroxylase, partial [Paracoccaceae bacterium]
AEALRLDADPSGPLAARYLGDAPGAVLLIRPDQVIAARWTAFDAGAVRKALDAA